MCLSICRSTESQARNFLAIRVQIIASSVHLTQPHKQQSSTFHDGPLRYAMREIAFAGVLHPHTLVDFQNTMGGEWQEVHAHQYMNQNQMSNTHLILDKPENHISDKRGNDKG
jgi:hypothetical protein